MHQKFYEFEIEVSYNKESDPDLNAALDVLAETLKGQFLTFKELKDGSYRKYGFDDQLAADDFIEAANLLISRNFPDDPIHHTELADRLFWDFSEAIYHHVEFDDLEAAQRFATGFRALFSTYLQDDMYDIFIMNAPEEDGGYVVIWAFPMESVISHREILDQEEEDVQLPSISKTKKMVN
jgi:hypothetical protein